MIQNGNLSPAQPLGSDHLTIIHYICQLGKLDILKHFASTHPESIVHTVLSHNSLLHCACKHGQVCIVKYLIDNGLYNETVLTGEGNSSPLHLAVVRGHLSVVAYLIEQSLCHTMLVDNDGNTLIHTSCLHSQIDIVKYLVRTGTYDPNVVNCHTQQTPLHVAAKKGYLDIVQYLVEEGKFDPSCMDDVGRTPLYLAVWNGRIKTVQYLASKSKGELLAITTGEDTLDDGTRVVAGKTPLLAACLRGHFNIVQYLVEECRCNITSSDANGRLPLHSASSRGNTKIVKYLIEECKCDPMSVQCDDQFQAVPLHFAAINGHLQITKYLIEEHSCDPMYRTKKGAAPLYLASAKGHFDTLKYLIEECKCDPMCYDANQWAPLNLAASKGHLPITKYLIEEHGCDPMCCTKKGAAPLHLASAKGHFDTVKYLIEESKCNPMCYDANQWAPLHFAASNGHLLITKYLIEKHNCDPMCCTKKGSAPLHFASANGHLGTVKYLIEECKCDPMSLCHDANRLSPIQFAASNGHLPVTKYLIEEHSCDPMYCTNKGSAPFHLASANGHFDSVKYLIEECNCDPMCYDANQWAPLHFAASKGHLPITKYLIEEQGCDPMCCTKEGAAPFHLASEEGHFDVVKYLIEKQGFDPRCQLKLGRTVLYFAAEKKHTKLVNYLLVEGADPLILATSFPQFTNEQYPFLSCYRTDVPLAGTKVFVLGNQGVGKSSLVESLKEEEKWFLGRFTNVQVSPNTAGIISHLFTSQNFGDVMLYDFAGHSVYYASHSVLIQNGTGSSQVLVFVLVLDLRLPTGDFTSQLEYWVSFLMCTCSAKMSLVIAGSHYDHPMSSIDFQAKKAVITKFMKTMNKARLIMSVSFVPLDCRKAKSTGIGKIRHIISQLSKGMNGKTTICTFHYMLLAFFKWRFGNTVAFQLSEAIKSICCIIIPLPSIDEEYIYTLCEDLCTVSCILLLKNNILSKSWLALDQSKVLNEIQRFKQNYDFVSTMKRITTGIVPHSLLVNNFPSLNEVTLDFVLRYMVEMEYCQLVDGGVLGKPTLDEPHYFFPDQVLGESATHVWPSDEKYKRYFGWLLKCKHDFFFPRIVQVLLLRLATQKELVGTQDDISENSLSQLRPGTKIWKSGVSWIDSGCEVVVEIIENSTGILVMTRCWNDYEVSHCRVRSAVIKTVLKVKEDICRQLETEEFIINPKQIIQYPPPHTSLLQVVDMCELTLRCSQPEPHVVVLYSMHSSSHHTQMTVADLIGFDPFLLLSKAGLNVLFNGQDQVMSSDTLRDIADDLSEHWEPMCKVLRLQSKEFQRKLKDNPPDPTDKCLSAILEACRVSAGGLVRSKWLREKLEKYSIICGRNLLVSDTYNVYNLCIMLINFR